MSDNFYINFSYRCPYEDVEQSQGFNSDGNGEY